MNRKMIISPINNKFQIVAREETRYDFIYFMLLGLALQPTEWSNPEKVPYNDEKMCLLHL